MNKNNDNSMIDMSHLPQPIKKGKLFLIREEDVEDFVFNIGTAGSEAEIIGLDTVPEHRKQDARIVGIRLKEKANIVQIDDSSAGRNVLTSNIRRVVGEKVTQRFANVDTLNEEKRL